ncbi:hypothetical protein GEOBRER4_n1651 [Citrifermentans bremense]|nr:hypothetical protein GEOBRER4_n1651 [Citrifermentans bremense]
MEGNWLWGPFIACVVYSLYAIDKRLEKIIDLLFDIKQGYRD